MSKHEQGLDRGGISPIPVAAVEETQQENEHKDRLANALRELVEILDVELDQYRDLLRLLRAQRDFFSAGDIGAFEELSKRQETLVLKIKTLEEARKSIVDRLAQYFGIPSADASGFTLVKLSALVEAEANDLIRSYSERCAVYRSEILSLIRELENLKENNAYLVQHALHHVSGILRIFASAHAASSSYSKDGQIKHNIKTGKHASGWG